MDKKYLNQKFLFIPVICCVMLVLILVYRFILATGFLQIDFKAIDSRFIPKRIEVEMVTSTKSPMMPSISECGTGEIDINNASAEVLDTLPGIGKGLSRAIVEQRIKMGGFTTPEDLVCTKGIGIKTYNKLKKYIKVSKYSGNDG